MTMQEIEKYGESTFESIKHLAKHTNFISEYKEEEDFIKPSKLLNVLKEETFNTYENRFIYTLIDMLTKFIARQEEALKKEKTIVNINEPINTFKTSL